MCEALNELFREWYGDELEEEKEKIRNEAVNKVNTLNRKLLELGRSDDIVKATTDDEYQQQLFKEFDF